MIAIGIVVPAYKAISGKILSPRLTRQPAFNRKPLREQVTSENGNDVS